MSTTTATRGQLTPAGHYAKAEQLLVDAAANSGAAADRLVAMAAVHARLATTTRPHDLTYGTEGGVR